MRGDDGAPLKHGDPRTLNLVLSWDTWMGESGRGGKMWLFLWAANL